MKQNATLNYLILIITVLTLSLKLVSAEPVLCSSVKYPSTSGSKNNISFTFDKPYLCGKFANGDWWVVGDKDGAVLITDVKPVASSGFNGMEINPTSHRKQGFDKRINSYNKLLNVSLPLRVIADTSVIKSVSVHDKSKCRPCLQFAAVLTIVQKPVKNTNITLRPSYFGSKKEYYSLIDNIENYLPKYSPKCCTKISSIGFNKIEKEFQGVRLDHIKGWTGRNLHPVDNMPDYGAEIAVKNAVAILRFMLSDFNFNNKVHKGALINYIQMSVDLHGMATRGMAWLGEGGHGNGRKIPILFGSYLLRENNFLETIRNTSFSEDEQVYYSEKAGKALYGTQCSDKNYWSTTMYGRGKRDCRDPYGFIDGGGHEIGDAYQVCCTAMPWKYTALAVRLLKKEKEWGNDAFLEYVDRWVNEGVWAKPDECAPYNKFPTDYRKRYGLSKMGGCIKGDGRYKEKHGTKKNAGHYRNTFGEQMWQAYR